MKAKLETCPEVVKACQEALDAMWNHVGNGFRTPYEKLIAELQDFAVRAEDERLEKLKSENGPTDAQQKLSTAGHEASESRYRQQMQDAGRGHLLS